MGGGASSRTKQRQERLVENSARLEHIHEELRAKEESMDIKQDVLSATLNATEDVLERNRLTQELEERRFRMQDELGESRAKLQSELDLAWRRQLEESDESRRMTMLEDEERNAAHHSRSEVFAQRWALIERTEVASRQLVASEELRLEGARGLLRDAQSEHQTLVQQRDLEQEAAAMTREVFQAERRASQRAGELLTAEVRTQVSETEALSDSHRALEGKARSLQFELSKILYTTGQKDHEMKVKESELHEVKQSLSSIQEEMDEVNGHLEEQCSRVQRVEGSLRQSRGLSEKVTGLRGMLRESHDALQQLCALLEQERARKEQCTQGLKQQKMRTELLLQLLHHFKGRTKDLTPQALLAAHQNGAQLGAQLSAQPAGDRPGAEVDPGALGSGATAASGIPVGSTPSRTSFVAVAPAWNSSVGGLGGQSSSGH